MPMVLIPGYVDPWRPQQQVYILNNYFISVRHKVPKNTRSSKQNYLEGYLSVGGMLGGQGYGESLLVLVACDPGKKKGWETLLYTTGLIHLTTVMINGHSTDCYCFTSETYKEQNQPTLQRAPLQKKMKVDENQLLHYYTTKEKKPNCTMGKSYQNSSFMLNDMMTK